MVNQSIGYYVGKILKKWYLVLILTMVCAAMGYAFAKFSTSSNYKATTSVLTYHKTKNGLKKIDVTNKSGKKVAKYTVQNKIDLEMTETYRDIANSDSVLSDAVKIINSKNIKTVDELRGKINIQASNKSLVLNIASSSASPTEAVKITNSVANAYKNSANSIMDVGNVKILKKASKANVKTVNSSHAKKYTLLGIFVGLYAGIMIAVFTGKEKK